MSILLGMLMLLAILAAVCLVTLVNPNNLKPMITEKVMTYSGRQLTMDGDLSWTLFPYLGVKIGHIMISNPPGFQQKIFAEVEHATVGVKLLPLFHKQIESSGITLEGMKLFLIKNAQGNTNWNWHTSSNQQINTPEDVSQNSISRNPLAIAISGLNITQAEITWIDEQKNQNISISKFELNAKNISLLNPFLVTSEFDFASKNPVANGHLKLSSQAAINLAKQIFSFRDLDMNAQTLQDGKKLNLIATGDVVFDLQQQTLQWGNFQGKMGNLTVDGKLNMTHLTTHPSTSGRLHVSPFDMKKWLQDMGKGIPAVEVIKEVSGDIDIVSSSNSMSLQGKLKIDEVKVNNIKITSLRVPMQYQNGILELSSITGSFYQGSFQGNTKVNLNNVPAQVSMQTKLINFRAESLMQDIGSNQKLKFTGEGNADFQINTMMGGENASLKNLNGNGQFSFNKGVLQGIDIAYLLNSASAFISRQESSSVNTQQTTFGNLTGRFVIRNGVVASNDLLMNSAEFTTKGQGDIDLVNQTINYHLQTLMNKPAADTNALNLSSFPIPILVYGSLKNPKIGLDADALAKVIAQQKFKNIKTQVKDTLKTNVPEKAGELLQNLFGH